MRGIIAHARTAIPAYTIIFVNTRHVLWLVVHQKYKLWRNSKMLTVSIIMLDRLTILSLPFNVLVDSSNHLPVPGPIILITDLNA